VDEAKKKKVTEKSGGGGGVGGGMGRTQKGPPGYEERKAGRKGFAIVNFRGKKRGRGGKRVSGVRTVLKGISQNEKGGDAK